MISDTSTFHLTRITKVEDEGEEMGCGMKAFTCFILAFAQRYVQGVSLPLSQCMLG